MRKATLTLLGFALLAIAGADDAAAAGRVSRFAALERLSNPFGVLSASQLSTDRFGLPSYLQFEDEEPTAIPLVLTTTEPSEETAVEESAEAGELDDVEFTPLSGTVARPPFRPRVRSPFRPPPRPSLP